MNIGAGRIALWQALRTSTSGGNGSSGGVLPSAIAGLSGWWDASDAVTSLDSGGQPILGWNSLVTSLADKSTNGASLTSYSFASAAGLPGDPTVVGSARWAGTSSWRLEYSRSSAGPRSRFPGSQCFTCSQLELDPIPGLVTPKLAAKFWP